MEQTSTFTEPFDVRGLIDELTRDIERYLGAVALFRALDCEPTWRAESFPSEFVLRVRQWLEPCEPRVSGA